MYDCTNTCMKVNDGTKIRIKRDILKPFPLPQMPYYASQLSATSRKVPQKCLNVKTLTFQMATRIYPVRKTRKKLSAENRLRTLVVLFGLVVLSVIVHYIMCFFCKAPPLCPIEWSVRICGHIYF